MITDEDLLEDGEESEIESENLADGGYHSHSKKSKETEEEAEEETEIEIVKDAKKNWSKDPMEVVGEDNDDDYSNSVKKRIGKLRASATELARQRDQEIQEKNELLAFAKSQAERLTALEAQMSSNYVKSIKHQEDSFTIIAKTASEQYKQALLTGNADQIADAHEKLTDAKVNLSQLRKQTEDQAVLVENQKQHREQQARQQQQQQQKAPDVPSSRIQWFQKNPWFSPNGADEKSAYAIALDRRLQAQGVQADSDEYFESIDKGMRNKFPSSFGVKRSPVTAPATRQASETGKTSTIQGNKIVLTQSQMNTAKRLGLKTPAQLKAYAIQINKVGK